MILIVYSSLSMGRIQAQLLENQQSTASIRYQFVQPQHFEMKAELDGGCYKGNQDLLSAEIHRKKEKPEYLQQRISAYRKRGIEFTAMTFIVNEQPISMNVLDDAFITQYCTNGTNIPVFIQGDIVNLKLNGDLEPIYFVRFAKRL
ncbi:hypothetical protein EXE10_01515 [Acinetobacter sp. WCHAc060033]|uniref:hypothetical protein n=1 Tax=Acinetobacter sp. WCHAc060033 TaxID=2518624 RepID=UPI001023A5E6|nr:hypothetical protein [Acinetobacter sp. WCHAc060033]RZG88783.1 hypothetical protein EXE10_01515 [Acinetobacter sp. WCHAc060033]